MTDHDVTPRGPARWLGRLRRFFDPEGEATRRSVRWLAHKFPDLFEKAQQQSVEMRGLREELESQNRRLGALTRDVGWMRRATTRQRAITANLFQMAGLQERTVERERSLHERMRRIVASDLPIVVGPWTGEVGFELMYWIPFLGWLAEQGLDPRRITVISRGGAAPWYRHLTPNYVDLLDLITPDEFRERTAGPKKQVDASRDLDHEIVDMVRKSRGLEKAGLVHPSTMFRLLSPLFRKRASVDLVESFTSYRKLSLPVAAPATATMELPPQYVACKFYFSKAFPDTEANRAFAADLIRTISRDVPVVLLSTALRLDEHSDFQTAGASGVYVVDAHAVPQRNLEVQTRLIAGSRGFVGTYGGFSYLAPFYGVRSVSFFSRRAGFESHHLELADRVFDQLLPGGFVALDRRAHELVEPAIARWPHASNETVHA